MSETIPATLVALQISYRNSGTGAKPFTLVHAHARLSERCGNDESRQTHYCEHATRGEINERESPELSAGKDKAKQTKQKSRADARENVRGCPCNGTYRRHNADKPARICMADGKKMKNQRVVRAFNKGFTSCKSRMTERVGMKGSFPCRHFHCPPSTSRDLLPIHRARKVPDAVP